MTSDGYIGWNEGVYGDALGGSAFPDCDPPPKDPSAPFVGGDPATGWGRSSTSKFTGYPGFGAKVPSDKGFSGAPVEPEPPR
jgi:hypothetical protein